MRREPTLILERLSNPDIEPVTLAELKVHIRTYSSDTAEDGMLQGMITTAREWAEEYTGRVMVDQTWRLTVDRIGHFPHSYNSVGWYVGRYWQSVAHSVLTRRAPVIAITSIVSVANDGTETTVSSDDYELRDAISKWPKVVAKNGASWHTGTFRITFRAGFADRTGSPQQTASVVPDKFKQAIKLHVEAMYDRDPVMMDKLLKAAEDLIKPERSNLQLG